MHMHTRSCRTSRWLVRREPCRACPSWEYLNSYPPRRCSMPARLAVHSRATAWRCGADCAAYRPPRYGCTSTVAPPRNPRPSRPCDNSRSSKTPWTWNFTATRWPCSAPAGMLPSWHVRACGKSWLLLQQATARPATSSSVPISSALISNPEMLGISKGSPCCQRAPCYPSDDPISPFSWHRRRSGESPLFTCVNRVAPPFSFTCTTLVFDGSKLDLGH